MNTFYIVARDDFESRSIEQHFKEVLTKQGFEESASPELVIAIGGDGTMLKAFDQFKTNPTYVGLHTGTLGFYADWKKEEAYELLEAILNNKQPDVSEYPLVHLEFELINGKKEKMIALNEAVIKSQSLSTFILEVYINNERFETFRGDGLIISTPSGSTAYNYSVLGSVIHPSLDAIQVAELAAINNREFRTLNRSFVLPKHHSLDLYVKNKDAGVLMGVDGTQYSYTDLRKIHCKIADEKVKFARYKDFPFWRRVKDKFLTN